MAKKYNNEIIEEIQDRLKHDDFDTVVNYISGNKILLSGLISTSIELYDFKNQILNNSLTVVNQIPNSK